MPKAIRIHATGGPEVMRWEDVEVPAPGVGEVRLRQTAIGVNFADINLRRGNFYLYSSLPLPAILGNEGVGEIVEMGSGVEGFSLGERVTYIAASGTTQSPGGYAEERVIAAERLARIPDGVTNEQAAAATIKGLTAWAIVRRTFKVAPGDVVLVHAAAGGVGGYLAQWSKHLGATVIGTAGSADKARIAMARGCDHVILYRDVDFVAETRRLFPKGVSAVFDGVGKDTFLPSLDCLRHFGMLVNYGNASGPPPLLDVRMLSQKGSLFVTRIGMGHFIADRDIMQEAADELFDLVARGVIDTPVDRRYPLREAASAHRDLESRSTVGSIVLIP